jgi:hypothetical protein
MRLAIALQPGYVVMATVMILTFTILMLTRRVKGFVEEEPMAIPTLVSPTFKIIKLMFLKVTISIETMLMVIAVILIAFTTSYIATYMYSSTHIDATNIPHTYTALLISNHYVNQVEESLANITTSLSYIKIHQVFRELPIRSNSNASYLLPLLIECRDYSVEKHNNTLAHLCEYVVQYNGEAALIDINSRLFRESINVGGKELLVVREDLSKYLSIPLLPGIFPIHTIGAMGGATITTSPSSVVVIPYSKDLYNAVCKNDCDTKTILIITSPIPSNAKNEIVETGLKHFDIVALRHDEVIEVYSPSLVPSAKTLTGVASAIIFSLIFSLSVSGGLAEKVAEVSEKLFLIGVTYDTITASTGMAITTIFAIFSVPLLALTSLGVIAGISILSYILSAITANILLTYRVSRKLKSRSYRVLSKPFLTISTSTQIDIEHFKQVMQRLFNVDDIFALSEVESLRSRDGLNEIRVELIYKRGFATLITVEIYEEKSKDIWSYAIYVDVWSIEELSKYELNKIAVLALSKVQGAITQCTTKS